MNVFIGQTALALPLLREQTRKMKTTIFQYIKSIFYGNSIFVRKDEIKAIFQFSRSVITNIFLIINFTSLPMLVKFRRRRKSFCFSITS